LADMGYTNVLDYEGGKQDWIDHGLPVESGGV
jgi:rhodanese-related sulfurtransferase